MTAAQSRDAGAPLPRFERWLTLWVAACIVAGVALGRVAPAPFHWLAGLEFAHVNLPVGLLIWAMIVPIVLSMSHIGARRAASSGASVFCRAGTRAYQIENPMMSRMPMNFCHVVTSKWVVSSKTRMRPT